MRAITLARIVLYLLGIVLALVAQSSDPAVQPFRESFQNTYGAEPSQLARSLVLPLLIACAELYFMLRARMSVLRWLLGLDIVVIALRGPAVVLPALVMFLTFRPSVKRFYGLE